MSMQKERYSFQEEWTGVTKLSSGGLHCSQDKLKVDNVTICNQKKHLPVSAISST
jgi:hypothetical protein